MLTKKYLLINILISFINDYISVSAKFEWRGDYGSGSSSATNCWTPISPLNFTQEVKEHAVIDP